MFSNIFSLLFIYVYDFKESFKTDVSFSSLIKLIYLCEPMELFIIVFIGGFTNCKTGEWCLETMYMYMVYKINNSVFVSWLNFFQYNILTE